MKKSRDAITIYHNTSSDNSEDETAAVSPVSHSSTETQSNDDLSKDISSIKLSATGSVQLTSPTNATTNAILSLKNNPFFQDKRKWDDSFTVAEKKELTGNIVKAAKDNAGETYVTLQEEEYTVLNLSHEDEDDSQAMMQMVPSDQDPKVKRKAQNRAAQRAFRERKERYVKELEAKIKQVQDANLVTTTQLVRENQQLRSIIYRLETENYALKGIPLQPYQHQATLSPQPPNQQQQQQQRQNGGANYPTIAPLLPQQPLLLPAYLSSPTPSVLQNSPSVNHMMMLASSPLQQYPMSPVVSTNITHNHLISTSPQNSPKLPLPISKKVSTKKNNTTSPPPQNNQPLEYTFSISTPASLRPSGGSVSSSKHTRSEPVELVQLYPPGGKRNTETPTLQKSDLILLSSTNKTYNVAASVSSQGSAKVTTPSGIAVADDTSSIVSDKTNSSINTQLQRKKIQQLELDMFDCHIDTEGQLFCEKLYNEVCNDAFNRLLSEPLFDRMGKLNLSISSYPVPIVTGHHIQLPCEQSADESSDDEEDNRVKENNLKENRVKENKPAVSENDEKRSTNEDETAAASPAASIEQKKLLTCPEIWYLLNQHEKVNSFTTDQLCQTVKELAKCSDSGPVLEESDLRQILSKMDQGYL
ncbi:hypothetical protein INT48_007592 [Thamnidium elegans]|uniref:BZIP domain-containing protein n=1 Tax=Thamnidium elegans TaxID=101142 RepID=A0A8H7VSH2_9FUNG|nr:hypothetical protein INT48_007592 [Thamnidium elegans]